ncbi:MAG TPA: nucleotidyltransferase domain-containing protein [Candidatus Competibacteraceae bacterium]|nr:nucleotidyltransferase domain-containing protein [Candidatus Competibacteraceae bacterium]
MIEPISNQRIVDRILRAMPEIWAIYRFGSAGTPYERGDSDIDLALLLPKPVDNLARWELAQNLARQLKRDVDLVDLQSASTVLRHQVFHHGQRIYCADWFSSEEFESRALSDYVRLNEARRGILQDIHARGRICAG